MVMIKDLPGKDFMAKNAPIGKPNTEAIKSEDMLTFIESQTISNKSMSRDIIRLNAVEKASKNTCILLSNGALN